MVWQSIEEKESSEFKPVKLCLNLTLYFIMLMGRGLVNAHTHTEILTFWSIIFNRASKPLKLFAEFKKWKERKFYPIVLPKTGLSALREVTCPLKWNPEVKDPQLLIIMLKRTQPTAVENFQKCKDNQKISYKEQKIIICIYLYLRVCMHIYIYIYIWIYLCIYQPHCTNRM